MLPNPDVDEDRGEERFNARAPLDPVKHAGTEKRTQSTARVAVPQFAMSMSTRKSF